MIDGPRNWKWMVPGAGVGFVLFVQVWINANGSAPMQMYCIYLSVPLMVILGMQSLAMFWAYYARIYNDEFVARRRAIAETAETRLFEMARLMHPETVRLLLMHRKTKWRIKESKVNDLVDWVLDADPRVRFELVEYVLANSNQYAMMAMNRLSDKAFNFDPDRLINDYDQYRAFHKLLMNRMMATDALGNQPGQWIEPWNPELVARQFGIALVEEIPTPLPAARSAPQMEERPNLGGKVQAQEQDLTDEEMESIRALEETHRKKYEFTVKEFVELKNHKSKGATQ